MRLLILGGTSEAAELARAVARDARIDGTISLAGRTRNPLPQALPSRSGGFGGIEGFVRYLQDQRIDAVIDATHPFAARMTGPAVAAPRQAGARLLVVLRPAWRQGEGDRWTMVPDMPAAARALPMQPCRVLLTVGQQELAPFANVPRHHYVIRSVDPPAPARLPPLAEMIAARGPFAEADEFLLLRARRIDVIVTKNSGGSATRAKLAAARTLRLPVVMVQRPPPPDAKTVGSVAEALRWLDRHAAPPRGE
jgi:precorrin-6A/cobalt-precorrin-6A reductase